jgi:uncharacterized protein (TIGR02391 family)
MSRPRILDQEIMSKIAKKIGERDITAVNRMVSRKANKLTISAESALVILAKEYHVGTSAYLRSLDAAKQGEVRDALSSISAPARIASHAGKIKKGNGAKVVVSEKASLKRAIGYLIEDQELQSRCQDILMAPVNFDRPINQATLVLEDRIRKKAQPPRKMEGATLIGYAFNEEILKTVLRVASNDPEDQRGFTQMLRGIFAAFRNKTHHHIIKNISREEAMRVCGFVDVLLRVVDNSVKVK